MPSAPSPNPVRLGTAHYLGYVVLCGIWGTTWLAIRVLVRDVPPLRGAAARFAIAAVLLLVPVALRRSSLPRQARERRALAILGVTMMAVPYGLLFWAEQYVTSSMTAVLFSCLPLVVALFTPFMSRHRVPRRAVVSMLVAVGGIAVLFAGSLSSSRSSVLGGLAVLAAVVFSAWSAVFAKSETARIDSVLSTCVQLVFGAVLLFGASAAVERGSPSNWTRHALLAVLFLAVAGSAVAFGLYYWLLKHMQAYQASTISLIVPIVAMLEGGLALGEPISLTMIIAASVVLLAVGSVLRAERRSRQMLEIQEEARGHAE